jgi:hypothetical protein
VLRQGDYKLLLNWDRQGRVASRELYKVAPDPREEGRNLAAKESERVKRMEDALLAYLRSAKAETVQSIPTKKGKKAQEDL